MKNINAVYPVVHVYYKVLMIELDVLQDGQSVSLEPGGQFELSGAPLDTLHQTCAEVNSHLYQVQKHFKPSALSAGVLVNFIHWKLLLFSNPNYCKIVSKKFQSSGASRDSTVKSAFQTSFY